jgi:FkbM family methyltransferase
MQPLDHPPIAGRVPELDAVLAEGAAPARERERRLAVALTSATAPPVVLVGAGGLGRRLGAELLKRSLPVIAFADHNRALHGSRLLGVPVVSHEDAARRWGGDALFVVAIWNGDHSFVQSRARLEAMGCHRVSSWLEIVRALGGPLLPQYAASLPTTTLAARDSILEQARVWADDLSMTIYIGQIAWRVSGDFAEIDAVQPDQYFPCDVVRLREDEAFVDCGAYTGDTIVDLVHRMPSFATIHAFEPDPDNHEVLLRTIDELGDDVGRRVAVHRLATSSENGVCVFAGGDGASSTAALVDGVYDAEEAVSVPCARLDDVLGGERVTYIKMDVEGAEAATLLGARALLREQRPLLAISAYHRPGDLWELPRLVAELTDGYALYLRAHRHDSFECVVYGVPEERRM